VDQIVGEGAKPIIQGSFNMVSRTKDGKKAFPVPRLRIIDEEDKRLWDLGEGEDISSCLSPASLNLQHNIFDHRTKKRILI